MSVAAPALSRSGRALGWPAVAVAAAWGIVVVGEVTGVSRHVGHDAVVGGEMPPGLGLAVFLSGWLVMVAAMMLPVIRRAVPPPPALVRFLGGFGAVWALAGVAALSGDTVVHRVVDGVPSIASRSWLVGAALLVVAGAAQLLPATRRCLAAGPD
ncbi:MAG: DUF2182 domain-containing protein, partial [Acidimicrobiales bacterium]